MVCCGGKRRRLQTHRADSRSPRPLEGRGGDDQSPRVYRRSAPATVYFEYRGPTRMTVIGSVSGRRYRFGSPGAVLAVDGRDGPAIAAVPGIQRVSPASAV